jgi:methylated-DNA-protein-cysteine methyltransferase-like protein
MALLVSKTQNVQQKKPLVAIKNKQRFTYLAKATPTGGFFLSLKVLKNKDFFQDVYDVVRLIPSGRVTSYGAIANYLGSKQGARMVGWAMNASHVLPDIPAHRVVNRVGLLSGKHHFDGPNAMEQRLQAEGIQIVQNQIQDFQKVFWDPALELGLP